MSARDVAVASLREDIAVKRSVLEHLTSDIATAGGWLVDALRGGGKVMLFGNGGSAADAQHIAAELVGTFESDRRALAAIALTTDSSGLTAIANDIGFDAIFSRQLEGLAQAGDVALALSTSGESDNVVIGARRAQELGLRTIALTGESGGRVAEECELGLCVPSNRTARIQEAHITIGHILCEIVDAELAG